MHSHQNNPRLRGFCATVTPAFTLVELLVVIGIISILIGILLPVVGRAQDQARSAACKSNLRQIFIAVQVYANDNKGSLPYGFYFAEGGGSGFGNPTSSSASPWVSWFTLLNKTMSPKVYPDSTNGIRNAGSGLAYKVSAVFRCPGAEEIRQQVHYFQNSIAMPHLPMELKNPAARATGSGVAKTALSSPAKFTDLHNDNALFWDTPLFAGVPGTVGIPFFAPPNSNEKGAANSVLAVSYIDDAAMRFPLQPERRFRDANKDLYANSSEGSFLRGDQSIYFPTDEQAVLLGSTAVPLRSWNVDLGGSSIKDQFYGNVRFRHQRNAIANVVFTDGSVQGLNLNKGRVISGTRGKSYSTDFKRNMLRIKWPTGFAPSDQYTP